MAAVRDADKGPAAIFVAEFDLDHPRVGEVLPGRASKVPQPAHDTSPAQARRQRHGSRGRVFAAGGGFRRRNRRRRRWRAFRAHRGAQLFDGGPGQNAPIALVLEIRTLDEQSGALAAENLWVNAEGNGDVAEILGEWRWLGWVLVWHLIKKLSEGGPSHRAAPRRIDTPPPGVDRVGPGSDCLGLDVDDGAGSGRPVAGGSSQPGSRLRN